MPNVVLEVHKDFSNLLDLNSKGTGRFEELLGEPWYSELFQQQLQHTHTHIYIYIYIHTVHVTHVRV